LIDALRAHLAPYKLPRGVTFVDEPIRDEAGKIRRIAWRERLIAQSS
jgi:bile acid-coenzyme A ligase